MHILSPRNSVIAFSLTVALLVPGCGETKVAQCNKLIAAINKGEPIGRRMEQESKTLEQEFNQAKDISAVKNTAAKSATVFSKFAKDVSAISSDVKVVELKDEKLKGFQTGYAQMIDDMNTGIVGMGKSLETLSKVEAKSDLLNKINKLGAEVDGNAKVIDKSARESTKIISDLNTYCGAK